jgi:hypothetical protein
MSFTLCTSGAATAKAGVHASSAILGNAATLTKLSDECEGMICGIAHYDFVSGAAVNARVANLVSDVCSSMIANHIIAYDPTGYLTREADTLLNLNDQIINKGLAVIKDKVNLQTSGY